MYLYIHKTNAFVCIESYKLSFIWHLSHRLKRMQ